MSADADTQRAEMRERWERAAAGWARRADELQEFALPVSIWMIEQLNLQPGQQVLELACGPGDTGFLAAERVRPGGGVIETDAVDAMLGVAKGRARDLGATNVEFKRMEIEWIDLPTASVDAVLCRWGLMFALDVPAAIQEIRRVVKPGGRVAVAVWDQPELNPWATIPTRALVELGHVEPPDPNGPGMFVLADAARLQDLLESGGLTDVVVESLELLHQNASVEDFVRLTLDLARPFAEARERLTDEQWWDVQERVGILASPFATERGLNFPAQALVAAASG